MATLLSGFLMKSPPLNKATTLLKGFKKRYFVLDDQSPFLRYYTSQLADAALKGEIDMTKVVSIASSQPWHGPDPEEYRNNFVLVCSNGREYMLGCQSEHDMTRWVHVLKERFGDQIEQNRRDAVSGLGAGDDKGNSDSDDDVATPSPAKPSIAPAKVWV